MSKSETIVANAAEAAPENAADIDRLAYAHIEGPSVTLAYLAEDKAYVSLQ